MYYQDASRVLQLVFLFICSSYFAHSNLDGHYYSLRNDDTHPRSLSSTSKTTLQNPCKAKNCTTPTNTKSLIFVHVPKTGGETVESVFNLNKVHDNAYHRCLMAKNQMDKANNITCSHPPDQFYFSVVRNPYDRMYSWFHFCIHGWFNIRGVWEIPGPYPFSGCEALQKRIIKDNHNFTITDQASEQVHMIYTQNLFEWYLNYTYNVFHKYCPEPCLPTNSALYNVWVTYEYYYSDPISKEMLVDHVFRFEDIYRKDSGDFSCFPFYSAFCEAGIKLDLPAKLPHENNDNGKILKFKKVLDFLEHKPYHMFYTEKAKAKVGAYYRKDLEKYNYRFHNSNH